MIKLLVLDLDGTLLDHGFLPEEWQKRLLELQQSGIKLMLATGRNPEDASCYVQALQVKENGGAVAFSDGQYLMDYADGVYTEFAFLEFPKVVTEAGKLTELPDPILMFGKQGDYRVFRSACSLRYLKERIRHVLRKGKTQLLLRGDPKRIADIDKLAVLPGTAGFDPDRLREAYEVTYESAKKRYEIKHKGVHKGNAVRAIQEKYGCKQHEVAVFGNDENDIRMLEQYENSYVVANAAENVREKARHVLPQRDGRPDIMGAIENLLKEG